MTSQGSPHARFRRALLTKNVRLIDAAAVELRHIALDDALRILVVLAEKHDPRFERAAARFAARVVIERRLDPAEARALCGSHEHAEDLVQDTYLRVLSRPRVLRNDDDLGYLLTVLRNTFFSSERRARSRPALATGEQLERIEDPGGPQPHEIVEAGLVFEAIATLPRPLREAMVAVDVAGLRYGEAARALGVRETTLTPRLFRARRRVAQMLRPGAHERFAPRVASLAA